MYIVDDSTMVVDLDRFYPTHQAGVGDCGSGDYRAVHPMFNCALCIRAPFIFALDYRFYGPGNES